MKISTNPIDPETQWGKSCQWCSTESFRTLRNSTILYTLLTFDEPYYLEDVSRRPQFWVCSLFLLHSLPFYVFWLNRWNGLWSKNVLGTLTLEKDNSTHRRTSFQLPYLTFHFRKPKLMKTNTRRAGVIVWYDQSHWSYCTNMTVPICRHLDPGNTGKVSSGYECQETLL